MVLVENEAAVGQAEHSTRCPELENQTGLANEKLTDGCMRHRHVGTLANQMSKTAIVPKACIILVV